MLESLDVAIGLIVVYLVLALACTALNEAIAAKLQSRAKTLRKGIERMLGAHAAEFYKHPIIKSLREKSSDPAYIPATAFRLVMLDVLSAPAPALAPPPQPQPAAPAPDQPAPPAADPLAWLDNVKDGELRTTLKALARGAGHDLNKLNDQIESWFNSSMERVAGWYKRNVQLVVALLALALTVACNADTFDIVQRLSQDDALRAQMVATAQARAANPSAPAPAGDQMKELEALGLLPGWGGDWRKRYGGWSTTAIVSSKTLGLLITALAVSLGAPFWFDVLNKVITVRAAGRAPEEGPKKPEDHPKRWS